MPTQRAPGVQKRA